MDPLIIEVALNGSTKRDRNPFVPLTPDEVAADALLCLQDGAAIAHSHIESFDLRGAEAAERYLACYRAVVEVQPGAILYGTTVSAETVQERFEHIAILAESGVARMGFLDPGSTNVGTFDDCWNVKNGGTYLNSPSDIDYACGLYRQVKLAPNISVYEPSFLRLTLGYHRARKLPRGAIVRLCFTGPFDPLDGQPGYPCWGFPPTVTALSAYLEMLAGSSLPWSVAVIGGNVMDDGFAEHVIRRGGHVRVGLEDYAGRKQPRNADLVKELATLARRLGRRVAGPEEASRLLDIPREPLSMKITSGF